MIDAMIILNQKLLETGMEQSEIDSLLSRFLSEEAEDYVKVVKAFEKLN